MTDYPYTQVTGKLKAFFDKVQQVGIPNVVDKKWLSSINFKGSNDPTIVPVLKFIDFVDATGKPTDRWADYRDKKLAGKILAEGIMKGYYELFSVYPDAHNRSDDELKSFFGSKTTSGKQVIAKTTTTLKALCGLANFEEISNTKQPASPIVRDISEISSKTEKILSKGFESGLVININIQLSLPETTDESIYDKLFISLKKNLLS